MMVEIDLGSLTKANSKVLAGHIRGVAASEFYKLDELEVSGSEPLTIVAPQHLETISPSFVQGFLGETMKRIGPAALSARLDFSRLKPFLQDDFEIGIQRLTLRSEVERH
ncbi:hypothetical protein [Salipiger bermudensis]|uniref:hypothetical protein n=1 Tax=Salipiger bermudensis TaxID=344736 RepID=UPI001CD67D48|nr:hypothetical protein [Salipiger bermudensis]MCA0963203.1 hypothetical protein [Salipiger bermudensis]